MANILDSIAIKARAKVKVMQLLNLQALYHVYKLDRKLNCNKNENTGIHNASCAQSERSAF